MATPGISVEIKPSHRQSVLACAKVTLQFNEANATIEIHDCRVMRNRQGVLWAALPSYSVTSGKQYEYYQSIALNPTLHREVTDAILNAHERWKTPIGGAR